MDKCIRIFEFAKQLFAEQKTAQQASQIMEGIMRVRSPRLSDIAASMPGLCPGSRIAARQGGLQR